MVLSMFGTAGRSADGGVVDTCCRKDRMFGRLECSIFNSGRKAEGANPASAVDGGSASLFAFARARTRRH